MKKLMFLVAMLMCGFRAASAQTLPKDPEKAIQALIQSHDKQTIAATTPQQVAELLTSLMINKLSLTTEQSAKVQEINTARLSELKDLWLKNQNTPIKAELKALKNRYQTDLKAAITGKQYALYEELVEK